MAPWKLFCSFQVLVGASEADLLDAYSGLTRDEIHAAVRYAAGTLTHEEVVFVDKDSAGKRE